MVNSFNVYRCAARSARLAAALMLVAVSVAGCRQKEPDMPAVATPTVTFSRDRVALGSPVKVTYRFQVAANATFEETTWLLWHGDLPTPKELEVFRGDLARARAVPAATISLLHDAARSRM